MTQQDSDKNRPEKEKIRAEAQVLLASVRAQLIQVQIALAAAGASGDPTGKLAAQVAKISRVVDRLANAVGTPVFSLQESDLVSLEQAVQSEAAVGAGENTTLVASNTARAEAVTASAAYTRQETQTLENDVFERHIFDSYLRFDSPADEAAFRRREADTKRYVDEQLARKTPEGDLNAAGGMQSELLDAHAHGAGASPDFMPRWNALAEATKRQHDAMSAAGQSTAEYDRVVTDSARQYLEGKGLSETEIKARLAVSTNPLDAVRPYIKGSGDPQTVGQTASPAGEATRSTPNTQDTDPNFSAISDKLKAAGIKVSDNSGSDPSHGLTTSKMVALEKPVIGA